MRLAAFVDARADQSRESALEIFGHLSSDNAREQRERITTVYSDIQISFGTLTTEGSRDNINFTVHVQEDEAGWNGTSPMIISYHVPEVKDIITITGHIDITSAKGKRLLTDRAPVQVEQATPFTLDVIIGGKPEGITIPLTFPAPVLRKDSRTRIARKSAYIEVIASPAKHSTNPEILDSFFLPTTKHIPGQPPATLNIPHINLDTLPIPSLTDKSRARFLTTLTSLMFSPRELLQRSQNQLAAAAPGTNNNAVNNPTTDTAHTKVVSPPSARLNFKESLHAIFTLVSTQKQQHGGKPPPAARLFTLSLPSSGAHILLFISALRLDAAHGSVVLDAAVVPLTKTLIGANGPLTPFLHNLAQHSIPSYTLTLTDAELALWKRTLPALAERCRTWMHRPDGGCEYENETGGGGDGGGKVPISLDDGEPVLCGCGCGELPEGFVDFPGWGMVKGHATRVAISPVFVSGMVEEVVEPAVARRMARESAGGGGGDDDVWRRCRGCGKLETVDDVVLKKCTRCLEVVYCSAACQKQDWKRHRVECAATIARGQK
jgi:hypothetical protein